MAVCRRHISELTTLHCVQTWLYIRDPVQEALVRLHCVTIWSELNLLLLQISRLKTERSNDSDLSRHCLACLKLRYAKFARRARNTVVSGMRTTRYADTLLFYCFLTPNAHWRPALSFPLALQPLLRHPRLHHHLPASRPRTYLPCFHCLKLSETHRACPTSLFPPRRCATL